jgi:hypothetical protein
MLLAARALVKKVNDMELLAPLEWCAAHPQGADETVRATQTCIFCGDGGRRSLPFHLCSLVQRVRSRASDGARCTTSQVGPKKLVGSLGVVSRDHSDFHRYHLPINHANLSRAPFATREGELASRIARGGGRVKAPEFALFVANILVQE